MAADIEKIKEIREKTGVSVGDIKKALDEADGNPEEALESLKERGAEVAEKKSSRDTNAGIVDSYIHGDRVGVLVELLCETDFVAKNDQFRDLAHDISLQVAASNPKDEGELLSLPFIKDESRTVKQRIDEAIGSLGENIKLGRFYRLEM